MIFSTLSPKPVTSMKIPSNITSKMEPSHLAKARKLSGAALDQGKLGLLNILETVEDILGTDPNFSEYSQDSVGSDHEEEMLQASPTPIGPRGVQQVVPNVAITDNHWHKDEALVVNLRYLLQMDKLPTKKRFSDLGDIAPRKKARLSSKTQNKRSNTDSEEKSVAHRFRTYQSEQWHERFEELIEFRKLFGHCLVPYKWSENVGLAQWVKRQRYQYKLKKSGMHATMTDERQTALEELGFVWDSHAVVWEERLLELRKYREEHGHCVVPNTYPENPTLATWVKCQRRQYKLFLAGKRSNITKERILKLNCLNFEWNPRNLKRPVEEENLELLR